MDKQTTHRETVYRLQRLERDIENARIDAGRALKSLIRLGTNPSDLSRLFGMTRPKIYWLIKIYESSEDANSNKG